MFMIYLHSTLHALCSSASLVTTINQKAKYRFLAAIMLFYILHKKSNKIYIFFEDLLLYSVLGPVLNGVRVTPI